MWSVAVKVNRRLVRVWVDVLIPNMEVPTIKVVIVVLRSGCLGVTFTLEDSYQEAGGYVQIGEYEDTKSVARGWIWEKEKSSGSGRDETPSIAYMSVRGENLQQWRQMLDRVGKHAQVMTIDEVSSRENPDQGHWEVFRVSEEKDEEVNRQISTFFMNVPAAYPGYPQFLPLTLAASDWLDEGGAISPISPEARISKVRWEAEGSFLQRQGGGLVRGWPLEPAFLEIRPGMLDRFLQRDYTTRRVCTGPEAIRDERLMTEREAEEIPNLQMGGRQSWYVAPFVGREEGYPGCRRTRVSEQREQRDVGAVVGTLIFLSCGYWDLRGIRSPIRWREGSKICGGVEKRYQGGELVRLRTGKFVLELRGAWAHVQRLKLGIHPGFARHGGALAEFGLKELQLGEVAEESRSKTRQKLKWDDGKNVWVPVGTQGGPARRNAMVRRGTVPQGDEREEDGGELFSSPQAYDRVRPNFGKPNEVTIIAKPVEKEDSQEWESGGGEATYDSPGSGSGT